MKKWIWWSAGITIAIVLISAAVFYFVVSGTTSEGNMENTTTTEERFQGVEADTKEESDERVEINEDGEGIPSEYDFQNELHYMTHQKVQARKKWGSIQITEVRLEEMIQIAEESNYLNRDFYLEVLNEWKNGDFTNAVDVHNQIWNERNGTVGKATGLMSESEEQRYIENNF